MASSNDSSLHDAGSIWRFLDKLSTTNPAEYKKYIDRVMREGEEMNFGPPEPNFVVETTKTPKVIPDRRYFINIGEWKQVTKSDEKDAPVHLVSSEPRKELIDKEWAMLIDVLFHPCIFPDLKTDLDKCTLVELILKHVEQKYGVFLSRKYKFLDVKYVGNQDNLLNFMCPSSLQNSLKEASGELTRDSVLTKMKHISKETLSTNPAEEERKCEELLEKMQFKDEKIKTDEKSSKKTDKPILPTLPKMEPIISANYNAPTLREQETKTLKNITKTRKTLERPNVVMDVNKDEEAVELTVNLPNVDSVGECDLELTEIIFKNISVNLPNVDTVGECDLELTEGHISLTVTNKYELELDLPVTINVDDSNAKFVKDLKLLLITAPLVVPKKDS